MQAGVTPVVLPCGVWWTLFPTSMVKLWIIIVEGKEKGSQQTPGLTVAQVFGAPPHTLVDVSVCVIAYGVPRWSIIRSDLGVSGHESCTHSQNP